MAVEYTCPYTGPIEQEHGRAYQRLDNTPMVARKNDTKSVPNDTNPLRAWQHFLGNLWASARHLPKGSSDLAAILTASFRRRSPVILGATAVIGGQVLAFAAADPRPSTVSGIAAFVALAIWLCVGLVVVWWLAGPPSNGPADVLDAWSFGLLPWIVGILPLLQVLSWIASAVLTTWALKRVMGDQRRATRAVAVAMVVQAGLALMIWTALPGWLLYGPG